MKNIQKYIDSFNLDLLGSDINDRLPFEIFMPVTEKIVKNIQPNRYFISNYSRVYDNKNKKFLKIKFDYTQNSRYPSFSVMCTDTSKGRKVTLHRTLMLAFYPDHDPKYDVVNHIDGNKNNSFLFNLEFTDTKGNAIHARDEGLIHPIYGENHTCATITDEQCHEICKLLEEGNLSIKDISKRYNVSSSIILSIRSGKAWKHISKEYKINGILFKNTKFFSNSQIKQICKFFIDNPKQENEGLMKYCRRCICSIGVEASKQRIDYVRKLYRRETWKYLWANF